MDNTSLTPVMEMTNEFCATLAATEVNGICINMSELERVETEFQNEQNGITERLEEIVKEVMGDTPVNLNSGKDLSILLSGRELRDRAQWVEEFKLDRKFVPNVKKPILLRKAMALTSPVYRTEVRQCGECKGAGKISKKKKDGSYGAPRYNCPTCGAAGVVYIPTNVKAGLCIPPTEVSDLNSWGFSGDKDRMEKITTMTGVSELAKEFATLMVRYNALNTYITSFCGGIRRGIRSDNLLHTQFMQAVTKTGRLSSRDPNFQNQPRGKTFPIRRCVVSRFANGKITEADFGGLEFRVAGALSGDEQIFKDLSDPNHDPHRYTADILTASGQETDRQGAKPHTFKPLYGGQSGTPAEISYYKAFLKRYAGVAAWQQGLCNEVVKGKPVVLPSGREYMFPFARRNKYGGVSGATKIKNYPVQGFATADIVPCAFIEVWYAFRSLKLKSLIILTVHDSIVVDTHPDELEIVPKVLKEIMEGIGGVLERRFNYKLPLALPVEVKQGDNWMDMEVVL